MKTTKSILKLAQALHEEDAKSKSFPMGTEAFADHLTELRKALIDGRFWIDVVSVSRSGMSRTLKAGYIKGNSFYRVRHPLVWRLLSCDKNGRIGGCGMDMMFAAQYNLWRTLCPKRPYQGMPHYNQL